MPMRWQRVGQGDASAELRAVSYAIGATDAGKGMLAKSENRAQASANRWLPIGGLSRSE